MYWRGKSTTIHIITLFVAFAMLTGFSLAKSDPFSVGLSRSEGADELSRGAYHFPDQAAERAILNKADDYDLSVLRLANQRFFDLLGPHGSGGDSNSSRFRSQSTENSFDTKDVIQIKLRI